MPRTLASAVAALALVGAVAGCGSGSSGAASPARSAGGTPAGAGTGASPSLAALTEDRALHDELPAADRTTITVGTTLTPTELPYTTTVGAAPSGLQPQLYEALGRILGVRIEPTNATFEEVIPGVQDGKFAVGVDNFGVTAEREKVIDFVTYFNDGQSFLTTPGASVKPVTGPSSITNLCGLNVGTTAGTTFQQILEDQQGACAKAGKKAFSVSVYSDATEPLLALKEGRIDVFMGPTAGNRYIAAHDDLEFLSQYSSTPVGFVLAHNSPLSKPLAAAVDQLIKDGTYRRILQAWDVSSLAVRSSQVNPAP